MRSKVANSSAKRFLWQFRESMVNLPVIHRLGIKFIPVDESSDEPMRQQNDPSVETVPMSELALHILLSTRLSCWP